MARRGVIMAQAAPKEDTACAAGTSPFKLLPGVLRRMFRIGMAGVDAGPCAA